MDSDRFFAPTVWGLTLIFLCLSSCRSEKTVSLEEDIASVTLQLQSRETRMAHLKHQLSADMTHSHSKVTADLDEAQEQLNFARLKLDTLKTASSDQREQARQAFDNALRRFSQNIQELESRYSSKKK